MEEVSCDQRPESKEILICETIWGTSFPDGRHSFCKDQKHNKLGSHKGQKGGQGSWNIGSKVERCEMSQGGRREPDHVGRTLAYGRRHLDLTLSGIRHCCEGFMLRSDRV